MWRKAGAGIFALGVVACGSAAEAGVYTDDLSKCLVRSASSDDQLALIQWMFSALALHPGVQQYANITDDQRTTLTKKAAGLFQRLLTVDCRKETVAAIKFEGGSSIEAGFKVLGEVATRGLFADPRVHKGVAQLATSFDLSEMKKLMDEAGVPHAAKPEDK